MRIQPDERSVAGRPRLIACLARRAGRSAGPAARSPASTAAPLLQRLGRSRGQWHRASSRLRSSSRRPQRGGTAGRFGMRSRREMGRPGRGLTPVHDADELSALGDDRRTVPAHLFREQRRDRDRAAAAGRAGQTQADVGSGGWGGRKKAAAPVITLHGGFRELDGFAHSALSS